MLTKKEILLLFAITFIPFSLYLTTPLLFGYDGYAFLNYLCHGITIPGQPPLTYLILEALPCNILAIKLVLFCLSFASVLILALTGKLFYPKNGWMAGVFAWFSPILLGEFMKFENDQFAFPFLFLAIYFFLKAQLQKDKDFLKQEEKKVPYEILTLACLIIAGLIWQGSIYLLLAFGLSSFVFVASSIVALLAYNTGVLVNILPNWQIVENVPLNGTTLLFLLLIGVLGLKKEFRRQAIFFLVLTALTAKLIILAVPFLALGFLEFYNNPKYPAKLKEYLKYGLIGFVFALMILPSTYSPKNYHFEAIDFALSQTKDNHIQNDWDKGYWIQWRGGKTDSFGHYSNQKPFTEGIVLTEKELDCHELKRFNEIKVFLC